MRVAEEYRIINEGSIASPALIYYPEIIRENTRLTIEMAGGPERLWPHVKTHKTAELIDMQIEMGIRRFKCATIAEMELVCSRGAEHALLAYPLVGPNIERFLDSAAKFPNTACYALGDSIEALDNLDAACAARGAAIDWFCDVNLGMDRTGVPFEELENFCRAAAERFRYLRLVGFHCYDGQNHQEQPSEREKAVRGQMDYVFDVISKLAGNGMEELCVIAGGSPTFPCHIAEKDVFLSPGTVFVWDWGYSSKFPDLPFEPGAALLTRVVSHPARGVFTLDLGYKAISSDPEGLRGHLLGFEDAYPLFQSEEHWTWRMPAGSEDQVPRIGQVMYVIPTHICPTTALYKVVKICRNHEVTGEWAVAARDRE